MCGGLVVVDDLDDAGNDRSATFIGDDESPVGGEPGLVDCRGLDQRKPVIPRWAQR